MWQNISINAIVFFLCWSSLAGHGACPEVWFVCPVGRHCRELVFGFLFWDGFRSRHENSFSFLSVLGPRLSWTCAGCHSLWVHMCIMSWWCCFRGVFHSHWLLAFPSLLQCFWSPEERGLMNTILFRFQWSMSLTVCTFSSCEFWWSLQGMGIRCEDRSLLVVYYVTGAISRRESKIPYLIPSQWVHRVLR